MYSLWSRYLLIILTFFVIGVTAFSFFGERQSADVANEELGERLEEVVVEDMTIATNTVEVIVLEESEEQGETEMPEEVTETISENIQPVEVEMVEEEPRLVVPTTANKPVAVQIPVDEAEKKGDGFLPDGLLWGVYNGYGTAVVSSFEHKVGESMDITPTFVNWDDPFPSDIGIKDKILLVFWEQYGVTLNSIISGEQDDVIRAFAKEAAKYKGKVILAPLAEMNGTWDPWNGAVPGNTPEMVASAWKRIYSVFGSVQNVRFAWTVSAVPDPEAPGNALRRYYPGDEYVDYIGVDGFNFNEPYLTYTKIFSATLDSMRQYNKPVLLLSIGCAAGPKKAEWIVDTLAVQIPNEPLIHGWVWFNLLKEKDWRVDADDASFAAFTSALPKNNVSP